MKTSELIKELQASLEKNGDLYLMINHGSRDYLVMGVGVQDIFNQIVGSSTDRETLNGATKVLKVF